MVITGIRDRNPGGEPHITPSSAPPHLRLQTSRSDWKRSHASDLNLIIDPENPLLRVKLLQVALAFVSK
jgi:hypothetical protein